MTNFIKYPRRARELARFAAAAIAGVALSACGGGGGGSGGGAQNVNAASAPHIDTGMWIANGTNVLEYTPNQLHDGMYDAVPEHAINSTYFGAPQGVSFDAAGDLWVMDPQANIGGTPTPALLKFSAQQLQELDTNAKPNPVEVITNGTLLFPQQAVFDAQGNFWVTDHNANLVFVFSAAQVSMNGIQSLTPAALIQCVTFNGPLGIVFDNDGTLWIANNGGVPVAGGNSTSLPGTNLFAFLANQLPNVAPGNASPVTLSETLVPSIVLSDDGLGSISAPWALVFDKDDNLWSSNANAPFTLVEFTPAQRVASAGPAPAITISPTMLSADATLNAPNGICFDNLGDLAAMNSAGAFGAAIYSSGQLVSGAQIPAAFIVGPETGFNAPAGCNFGPAIF